MENKDTLLAQAKRKMAADMESRGFGAVIWDLSQAGFHYIPEIVVTGPEGKKHSVRVTGLYASGPDLYAIEDGNPRISVDAFYTPGVDAKPVVVTLSPAKAAEVLGEPLPQRGFTTEGTLEEWLAVADCYFEALAED